MMLRRLRTRVPFLCLLAGVAQAQHIEIPLWPAGAPGAPDAPPAERVVDRGAGGQRNRAVTDVHVPTLTVHPVQAARRTGTAIIICPGGGYAGVVIDKEGHDIARWLNSLGVVGVVLKYRLPRPNGHVYGHAAPLTDALRAIAIVRKRAGEWGVDKKRVGLMGFSAGGHLAATAGTRFERDAVRPDFLVLVYPVISMRDGIGHDGSSRRLLGRAPSAELVRRYSNEDNVSAKTPPTFLVSTSDDPIKVENSLAFYRALRKFKVSAELHVYERGGHGYGILPRPVPVSTWNRRLADWLRDRRLLTKSR